METCIKCQYTCSDKYLLLKHIKSVHKNDNSFMCIFDRCNRNYSSVHSLQEHVRRKHKISKPTNSSHTKLLFVENFDIDTDVHVENINMETNIDLEYSDFSDCESYSYDIPLPNYSIIDNYKMESETEEELFKLGIHYIANAYKYKDVNRNTIQSIVNDAKRLCQSLFNNFKKELNNLDIDEKNRLQLRQLCDDHANCLEKFDTEQKCLTQLKKLSTFIEPETVIIGERKEVKKKEFTVVSKFVPVSIQVIPLRKVFQRLFEIKNLFQETLQYMETLYQNEDVISNFIQGEYWNERRIDFEDRCVMPLLLFYDDYENNNPLGSHKGLSKTGAVYVSIPCLPVRFQSKLENIFVLALFNTLDKQYFNNEVIFSRVIEELNYLQEFGVTVNLPTGEKKIYFEVALSVADNLGQHSILGFLESFSAKMFCHICLTPRNEINSVLSTEKCDVRKQQDYETHLSLNNSKITGIKERCVLHKLNNFHLSNNVGVDPMHDVLEGVARYDLALILNDLIYVKSYFTLEELNNRLLYFDYGKQDNINKPTQIYDTHLKNRYIIMSSSEMKCFIIHYSLIIGHKVPEHDETWQLYLSLKDLTNIIWSPDIHKYTHKYLGVLIEEYLWHLQQLFPNSMKPKHHFLLHYSHAMLRFGPLGKISTMRFEGKHKDCKRISNATTSRLNINKTIAIRHQMILNYRFINTCVDIPFKCGKKIQLFLTYLNNHDKYYSMLPVSLRTSVVTTKWIEICGNKLSEQSVLVKFVENNIVLYLVSHILIENTNVYILCERFEDCYFDKHYSAFKIYNIDDTTYHVLNKVEVEPYALSYVTLISNGYYYVPKTWI